MNERSSIGLLVAVSMGGLWALLAWLKPNKKPAIEAGLVWL
jgi:hypothetical protein